MRSFILSLLLLSALAGRAQSVVGYWYGTANISMNAPASNYMVELIIQQKQSAVQAVMNYYFKDTYRSVKLNGNYNHITRELSLFNIQIPHFTSTNELSFDCPMDFVATHRVAKAGSNLVGRFRGQKDYQYTCPDIVFNFALNTDAGNLDSVLLALKNFKETKQVWSPSADDTLVAAVVQQRKIENPVVNREFGTREVVVQKEIFVDSDSITVDFYDNGEVDGDSISVFYNDQLLAANLRLSTRSIHLDMVMDSTREYNTIAMFANNVGSIPPNTALMIIHDGKKRYEVRLSSSLDTNAALRIRRRK